MQPPGQMPAGPTMIAAPPAKQGSGATKYIVIGCLVIILFVLVGGGALVYFGAKYGGEMATEMAEEFEAGLEEAVEESMGEANAEMDPGMEEAKQAYLSLLSKGHKQSHRDRFETNLDDIMIQERARLGLMKWSMSQDYQNLIMDLSTLVEDGSISVKESKGWCDKAEVAIAENQ